MVYIYNNMFFCEKDFYFWLPNGKVLRDSPYSNDPRPMLIYCEFPSSSLRCRANPNMFRRSFEPFDQMLYHRMVMEPHTAYPIPAGTRYILPTSYRLPTPAHVPAETNKRPLEQQPGPSSKNRVFITPVIRPPVLIARPSTALSPPQPVSIPDPPELTTAQIPDPPAPIPPELTTPQILLPDPPMQTTLPPQPPELMIPQILLPDPTCANDTSDPFTRSTPVVETLEPTLMDASSIDQISFGSDLEKKGVELRFFQLGRPPSHRVWEAYQPQTTDAYSVGFYRLPSSRRRVREMVDVVGRLGNASRRQRPLPHGGLQPWKRAFLENVQRSHEKALANGMPSDVTLLEHI
ncbi:hypothetical protein TNCV_3651101 [Trichonephila clavipes]|nr:hypothetical protein TNCV_3651101 [Trichonephila clavipes]